MKNELNKRLILLSKDVLKTIFLSVFLMGSATMGLTACSDHDSLEDIDKRPENDQQEEQTENKKPQDNSDKVSQELYDKAHAIYDKTSTGPQTVTSVNLLATLTSICAANDEIGPISITDASLNGEDITLVTLGGTDDVEGQATTMEENKLAGFGEPNDYLTAVVNLFHDGTIPQDKPVMVTGISLGGMIAQQLLGVQDIQETHTFKALVTFGSPITLPLDRQGVKVVRFADKNDKVPQLGEMILRMGVITDIKGAGLKAKLNQMDEVEKISRTSKYTDIIETHALSYIEDQCWSDVDFLGDPEMKNVLELKEQMTFYPAPKLK